MREIYFYHTGSCAPVQEFLKKLPDKQAAKMHRQLMMLRAFPLSFGRPHTKHFQIERYRSLYELREKCGKTLLRIIFTYDHTENIILLKAFQKTQSRDTVKALERAFFNLETLRRSEGFLLAYEEIQNINIDRKSES